MTDRINKNAEPRAAPGHPWELAPSRVLYVYGISRTRALRDAGDPSPEFPGYGVDGVNLVRTIKFSDLVCWASLADALEFSANLRVNMEQLEWLATMSFRHQRIVAAISAKTLLLPARFGCVFDSVESLEKDVQARRPALLSAFKHIAGADEWGIRIVTKERRLVPRNAIPPTVAAPKIDILTFQDRRAPDVELQRFTEALNALARASAIAGRVGDGRSNLQWQGAFLLPRNRRKEWASVLDQFSQRWEPYRHIECNGPWPPYSFVST